MLGSWYLSGGQSLAYSMKACALDELNIDTFMEFRVVAQFADYDNFITSLNDCIAKELSGVRTELSDFAKVDNYKKQIFSIAENYGATFELMKDVAGIPDSDNDFVVWLSLFGNYFGKAMNGLSGGIIDFEGIEAGVKNVLNGKISTIKDVYSCVSDIYTNVFAKPITIESVDDLAEVIVSCGTLLPGGDVLSYDSKTLGTNISTKDWYSYAANICKFINWTWQIDNTEIEISDYRANADDNLKYAIYVYDVLREELQ